MNIIKSIFAALIILFSSSSIFAQKEFEGKVVYETSYENVPEKLKANAKTTNYTYYFKKNKSRLEIIEMIPSYEMNITFITDYDKGEFTTITNMKALTKDLEDVKSVIIKKIEADVILNSNPITYFKEFKKILGYDCQKAKYTIYSPIINEELEITCYVNKNYLTADLNAQPGRHKNPFLIMEYSHSIKRMENMISNSRPISVSEEPIKDELFDSPPSTQTIQTYNSNNKQLENKSNKTTTGDIALINPIATNIWLMSDKGCKILIDNPDKKRLDKKYTLKWSGECKDGFANGVGKLEYEGRGGFHKIVFEGILLNGKKEGIGKENGYIVDQGSYTYEGNYKNNLFNGQGTKSADEIATSQMLDQNNSKGKYVGEFKNGHFEGMGSLYNRRNELRAQGLWFSDIYSKLQFWNKDEFDSDSIYSSYKNISVVKLNKVKGFKVVYDTILQKNSQNKSPLNANFSENSSLFYAKVFGMSMILNCETESLTKANICLLEGSYSPAYKIELEKNRCLNVARYNSHFTKWHELIMRDYYINEKRILIKPYVETIGNDFTGHVVGGVLFEDYDTGEQISKFILNPNPKEYKKTDGLNELIDGINKGIADAKNDDAFKDVGTAAGVILLSLFSEVPGFDYVKAVAINPKYNYIVTSHTNYHDILIWATDKNDKTKINNSAPVLTLKGVEDYSASQLIFDPSCRFLIVQEEAFEFDSKAENPRLPGTIIWDMVNRKKIASFPIYLPQSFSKNGQYLILGAKFAIGSNIIVVEVSSGKIVYEYKDLFSPIGKSGSVTSAYFSPDGKKIGISSIYSNGFSNGKNKFSSIEHRYIPCYTIIYPDYDFTPKISDETKINSLQSLIPFPVNKNILLSIAPFKDQILQTINSLSKPELKGEFESTAEYNTRTKKYNQTIISSLQKYWEKGTGFYIETVNQKELFTCKPTSLVKYDADKTLYLLSLNGMDANFKMPSQEAKELKEMGLSGYVISGEKTLNTQTNLYDYKNLVLKNIETGKSYPGNYVVSFTQFLNN